MLGMVGALLIIWIGLHILSGGLFLTPRNLWNLSVQTSSVASWRPAWCWSSSPATSICRSARSLGFVGMIMGVAQAEFLPRMHGLPAWQPVDLGHRARRRLALGLLIGAFQGFIIAYLSVPAFIVTLGGLLVWRGAAWWVTSGRTVAPMDATFRLMGGGPEGSIGATWSWIVGIVACVAVVLDAAQRPHAAQALQVSAAPGLGRSISSASSPASSSSAPSGSPIPIPGRSASSKRYAEANGITIPEGGLFIAHGIAIPVLIAVGRRHRHDLHHHPHPLRPLCLCHRRQSGSGRTRRHQHPLGDHEDLHDRWACSGAISAAISIGPPQRGDQCAGHARRAAGHRRGGHRRHVARRRLRHDRRRHARRAAHAVAAVRHGAAAASTRRCRASSSASCWSSPSGSTPSTASASSRGVDHGQTHALRSSK